MVAWIERTELVQSKPAAAGVAYQRIHSVSRSSPAMDIVGTDIRSHADSRINGLLYEIVFWDGVELVNNSLKLSRISVLPPFSKNLGIKYM